VTASQVALDAATDDLTEGRPGADDAYGDALEHWLALGGADLEERAAEVVADVAPGVALDAPMTGLSGGQAARVGLATSEEESVEALSRNTTSKTRLVWAAREAMHCSRYRSWFQQRRRTERLGTSAQRINAR
jgi:hypothetical protein